MSRCLHDFFFRTVRVFFFNMESSFETLAIDVDENEMLCVEVISSSNRVVFNEFSLVVDS